MRIYARTRVCVITLLALWTGPILAQSAYDNACPTRAALSSSEFSNNVARAVFQVLVTDAHGTERANGTATLIDRRGYYLTAGHVVDQYAKAPNGKVRLRRYDGKTLDAQVVANFLQDDMDLAVVKADLQLLGVQPVSLRISNPFGSGRPSTGWVLAYKNASANIDLPVEFSVGGTANDIRSMTLGFAAIGGNSGALLLEPNGRAFGILRDGPNQAEMQISLYVPATLVPSRNGHFAIPEIPIAQLPEDFQLAVAAASKSKALTVSSFWDRLAATIPPSPNVDVAIAELRSSGWRATVPIVMAHDTGLTSIDVIHFYRRISQDNELIRSSVESLDDVVNFMAETCSSDALKSLVLFKATRLLAQVGASNSEFGTAGKARRATVGSILASVVREVAQSTAANSGKSSDLLNLVSDFALVEANRLKLGDTTDQSRLVSLVSMAEGLGGTPTSGELAGLIASRSGDKSTGAAFIALANLRLGTLTIRTSTVNERRETLGRIYFKFGGTTALGGKLDALPENQIRGHINARISFSPIAASLTKNDEKSAIAAAALIF